MTPGLGVAWESQPATRQARRLHDLRCPQELSRLAHLLLFTRRSLLAYLATLWLEA